MTARFARLRMAALAVALVLSACATPPRGGDAQPAFEDGIVQLKSAYGVDETIARIKADIAGKGIMYFATIDQAKLAADADIALRPSSLLIFGNPPLGTQFITSNPTSGLDWPVRVLVFEDAGGQVWVAYNDFGYIARRHHIEDRQAQFAMATMVIESITSAVKG